MGIRMWICWEGVHYCACPANFPLLWKATNFHHVTILKCLSLSFICQMPLLLLFSLLHYLYIVSMIIL